MFMSRMTRRMLCTTWLSHVFVLLGVALVAFGSPTPQRLQPMLFRTTFQLEKKDVAAPPVTSPDASTVWTVGSTETVTWDISSLPEQISNPIGSVVLGFIDDANPDSGLNLMLDSPLAQGFSITAGQVSVTVPDVPTRNSYIIALIGSSGNISPEFTITNSSSPELPPGGGPNTSDPLPPPEPPSTLSTTVTPISTSSDSPTSHPQPPTPNPTEPGAPTETALPDPTATAPGQAPPETIETTSGTTTTGTTTTITGTGSAETGTDSGSSQGNTNAALRFSTSVATGVWAVMIPVVMLAVW